MASAIKEEISEHESGSSGKTQTQMEEEEEEEEEELFEINLEAVNSISPPHYWEAFFTATSSALLANCLLPISDLSNAVPTVSTACREELTDQYCHACRVVVAREIDFLGSNLWRLLGYNTRN